MPNWSENTVIMYGDEKSLRECFDKFGGNEDTIDFDRIIPMPKELEEVREVGSLSEDIQLVKDEKEGKEISENDKKRLDSIIEDNISYRQNAEKSLFCLEHYGAKSWYDWSVEHWGTKWNANTEDFGFPCRWSTYHRKPSCRFVFYTAWAAPLPIIEKLSAMYPKLTFRLHEYECGNLVDNTYVFRNGCLIREVNRNNF
ncbi:MAG: hypothetical protein J6Y03_01885 [Alphaproteobacteria bacterium]|nr:hypothetical protein [Alphaproteobacteria bacterium]